MFFSNLLLLLIAYNLKITLVLIFAFGLMLCQIADRLLAQAFRLIGYAFVVLEVLPVFLLPPPVQEDVACLSIVPMLHSPSPWCMNITNFNLILIILLLARVIKSN